MKQEEMQFVGNVWARAKAVPQMVTKAEKLRIMLLAIRYQYPVSAAAAAAARQQGFDVSRLNVRGAA